MKKLLCIPLLLMSLLLMLGGLAFGQNIAPPCNAFDINGVPILSGATNPYNCTDYFGSGNWANSPLPAGTITGFTLIAGGSGYANPVAVVKDITGATFNFNLLPTDVTAGVITSITGGTGGTNYTMPQVTIVDVGAGGSLVNPTCGTTCGTGALATAVIGSPFTGGIHKFLDPLKSLPIAVPDTITFPGSDFYVIALTQFTQKMHTDLPATTVRGYVQLNNGTDATGANTVAPPSQSYLGPVIIAQKNRPVRVLFKNLLPTSAGGNLFIPTDTTYMGAGKGPDLTSYTQNRATLHLHGGATPWISDGTPHQWTVPVGDPATLQTGASVEYVPDMYFVNGNVIRQCSATVTTNCSPTALPTGATNNPGQGSLTFYWTNQQGGRLMFYHDHAYGITRLNVYAGEAAGYLLYDPAEEAALAAATAPGSITAGDLAHLIPLVIQDKTFVPSTAQVGAQDPTWAGNYGSTPLSTTGSNGDLWFPHVYMPNQNPADPGLANGFGRWDYGPWFFPPQTSLTAATPNTAVTVPCTSAAFPGVTIQPTPACPTCGCPITPNPSGTPEGFMDTPVVNGVAYPVLHVAPAAYRFKILAAGNDRSWNLSWFLADATGTEVAMLPAAPPVAGSALPLCGAINPVAVPQLGLGLVSALLDGTGNPMNGTGLPLNCWPNYGPLQGIPAPQTMWAADGRAGGAPDPRRAGPPWIQIGSEGGLLPSPVVIPATPVNYEQNTRSITIGSVAMHGLWLGPAERADVIVDFSKFAGQTLILYNDAPAPAPAFDSRIDYFTGNADQTPIGGAPSTQPGYGPNTRTIMRVVVDGTAPNTVPFSLSALKAAFVSTTIPPAAPNGLFASTQPTIVVPEAIYNSAYNRNFPNTYMGISANNLTFTPITYPLTFDQGQPPCTTGPCNPLLDQKAIQELFTLDYGRMNATLGTEVPLTNFQAQTTIPLGYVDWPTELIQAGQTQLWKITHNGVDTHFIHFHLFNVQVVNRVGWDGSLRQPDSNEVGWKDTVRMNPLEDILVALQPITPTLPFPLPDSIRPMDVTMSVGAADANISGLDPTTGNATISTTNAMVNFGWEYVWHCHILGHEENDMMRPIIFQVAPPAPSNLVAAGTTTGKYAVNLSWKDNSASETSWTIQRDTNPGFTTTPAVLFTVPSTTTNAYGGTITYADTTASKNTVYYYRTKASDNFQPSSPNPPLFQPGVMSSAWSNTAASNLTLINPTVTFTGAPASAAYNTTFTVTATTNASTMPVISGTVGVCTVGAVSGTPSSATAPVTMISGTGTCTLTSSWAADVSFNGASATQTTTETLAAPTVSFTGAPASMLSGSTFTVTATTNAGVMPSITTSTPTVCTVSAVSGTPTNATATVTMINSLGTCTTTAAWGATTNYAAASLNQSTLAGSPAPTVTFTGAPASMVYGGTFPVSTSTNAGVTPTITGTGACVFGPLVATTATITMTSGTGTCQLTAAWPAGGGYTASSLTQSTAATKLASATMITSNTPNPSVVGQAVAVNYTVTGGATPLATPTGSVSVRASTGESCTGTLSSGTGTCSLTFTSRGSRTLTANYGGDTNYNNSSSSAANQLVGDFSITVSPTSSLINGGQTTTYTMSLTSLSNLPTGTVSFACSSSPSLPAGFSCNVSSPITLNTGGTATANVTVNTAHGFPNTYNLTFTGIYGSGAPSTGGLTHTTTATLRTRN